MITDLFDFLSGALYQSFALALVASFLWGIAGILLSPCHMSSIPRGVIVLFGTAAGKVQRYLNWTESSKAFVFVKRVCGVLVMLGGVYMIYTTFQ